VIGHKAVLENP